MTVPLLDREFKGRATSNDRSVSPVRLSSIRSTPELASPPEVPFLAATTSSPLHSIGEAVTELGRLARYLQAGFVRGYAAIILTGALILIGLFAYFGFPR